MPEMPAESHTAGENLQSGRAGIQGAARQQNGRQMPCKQQAGEQCRTLLVKKLFFCRPYLVGQLQLLRTEQTQKEAGWPGLET